ncbi:MAG: aldehyde ferredoxin oxidoreductase C-terminal domain-containing protein [Eubacteriales bacterium]
MNNIIRIDIAKKNYTINAQPDEYKEYGGKGFIAKFLNEEIDPKCDPLGAGNKLIIVRGLLGGTNAPNSGRISLGGKSPLTGTVKESNSGGMAAHLIARLGIKAIIIDGKPEGDDWCIIKLGKNKVEFLQADEYLGKNTYETADALRKEHGEKICIMVIGAAGERQHKSASVQITDMQGRPARACGRGGLGALMGSKKIKAIVIENAQESEVEYMDKALFTKGARGYAAGIKAHPVSGKVLSTVGTAGNVNIINSIGALPTNNFSQGSSEMAEMLSGEHLAEIQKKRNGQTGHRCSPGCVVCCSNVYNDSEGNYISSGFEYETIILNGSNCGIYNLDTVAKIDRMCDDFGIDTMETGCTIAVCMEAGVIPFGDEEGALALVQEMIDGTERGNVLAQGTKYAGEYFGLKRVPTIKGQAMAAYDPRSLKGTGVTQATSPMGADHTAGNSLGAIPVLDPRSNDGQLKLSTMMQKEMANADNMGICLFASFCLDDPDVAASFCDMLAGMYGGDWTMEKLMEMGEETLRLEKKFNRRAGITDKDDGVPDFMKTEPLPPFNTVFDFTEEELESVLPF